MDRQRHRQVGARLDGEMDVGLFGQHRGARIDHDETRALSLRLADIGHQVDARRRGIGTPQHDETRVGEILVRDRRHPPVERAEGGAGRRRAYGARQPRGAEAAEERGVARILREQAVRAPVRIRQDRLAAPAVARLGELSRDESDRVVPRHPLEARDALRSLAPRRMQQPIRSVHALREAPDFRANVAASHRIERRTVQ
jgi:hypothetical protein